jgi:hypothetical protein
MIKNKIFGYTSFVAAVFTILDLTIKYLFRSNEIPFSLTTTSGIQIGIVILLMALSAYFLQKVRQNDSFLSFAGYLYSSVSFVIYVITAYQYVWGNKEISNFSLEIFIVFITSMIASIIIFKQLNEQKYFEKLAYLFMGGSFLVILMLLINILILGNNEMDVFPIVFFTMGGIALYSFFIFLAKITFIHVEPESPSRKIKRIIGDDTKW